MKPLTDREFAAFQELIAREAGIWLADTKRALLVGRLSRRLRELNLESFGEYHSTVLADQAERVLMLDAIATNETHFFREPKQFELLADRLVPQWEKEAADGRRVRKLRLWSAACSTGQEPYSLAMLLHDRLGGARGWHIEILASDLSTKALAQARDAVWPEEKVSGVPVSLRARYMERVSSAERDRIRATGIVRDLVRCERINLSSPSWPAFAPFDAVFCRNVLIYFNAAGRKEVISRLVERLAPGGYLFLGHAESLTGTGISLETVMPAVYRKPKA